MSMRSRENSDSKYENGSIEILDAKSDTIFVMNNFLHRAFHLKLFANNFPDFLFVVLGFKESFFLVV